MYINYLRDRNELGFSCSKDISDAEKISDLLKRTRLAYIFRKGKQIWILIFSKFSKGILVAVLIFVTSTSVNINPDVYHKSSFSPIRDSILKIRGGNDKKRIGKS